MNRKTYIYGILTAGSSCAAAAGLSLITEGEGEVGRGKELALEPPPTLRVSILSVLPGDPLLRSQGRGAEFIKEEMEKVQRHKRKTC